MSSLSNPFARWKALQAPKPMQVGEVVAVSANVAAVELPSGGVLRAIGQATVGDRVYVRDGQILGTAPTLTYITAEV